MLAPDRYSYRCKPASQPLQVRIPRTRRFKATDRCRYPPSAPESTPRIGRHLLRGQYAPPNPPSVGRNCWLSHLWISQCHFDVSGSTGPLWPPNKITLQHGSAMEWDDPQSGGAACGLLLTSECSTDDHRASDETAERDGTGGAIHSGSSVGGASDRRSKRCTGIWGARPKTGNITWLTLDVKPFPTLGPDCQIVRLANVRIVRSARPAGVTWAN